MALLICLQLLPLAGCSIESGDGLASLPKLPGEYLALQKKLDDIMAEGYTQAVAEGGSNRQAVQLQDIDGDGEDEIVSFFRNATSGEYAVYLHKKVGDDYVELGHTRGYGKYLREVSAPLQEQRGQGHRPQLGHGGGQRRHQRHIGPCAHRGWAERHLGCTVHQFLHRRSQWRQCG